MTCISAITRLGHSLQPTADLFLQMGDFSLSSFLGHLETSKPWSKEALSDPLAMTTDELVRHTPDSFGSLDLAEVRRMAWCCDKMNHVCCAKCC